MTNKQIRKNTLKNDYVLEITGQLIDALDITKNTAYEYKKRARIFVNFCGENDSQNNILLAYKRYLSCRSDYAVSTKNKYLTTARIVVTEMVKNGLLPVNFPTKIKSFKQNKKHKRYGISETELKTISVWTNNLIQTAENLRLRAILSLLALQGLRQIEICRLDVEDYDSENKVLHIQGKGKDDKEMIVLNPLTCAHIENYINHLKLKSGPLFYSRSNNSLGKRLTTKTIRNLVGNCLNELGIDKSTHAFRHFFVTKLIKSYNGNIVEVAEFTRHKSLDMLQIYNDNIKREENTPKFINAFADVSI